MVVDWSALVGFVGLGVVIIGGILARDRSTASKINKNHELTAVVIKEGDDRLHERVNRLREDMSEHFVRRSDLDKHLQRIENGVSDIRTEMREERRETNQRLDSVLAALSANTKTS